MVTGNYYTCFWITCLIFVLTGNLCTNLQIGKVWETSYPYFRQLWKDSFLFHQLEWPSSMNYHGGTTFHIYILHSVVVDDWPDQTANWLVWSIFPMFILQRHESFWRFEVQKDGRGFSLWFWYTLYYNQVRFVGLLMNCQDPMHTTNCIKDHYKYRLLL